MKVFIPTNDTIVAELSETMLSIKEQVGADFEIIQVSHPLPEDKNIRWKPGAKEVCRRLMIDSGDEFTIINDCEFKNLSNTNYIDMKNFLEKNRTYGAVSLFYSDAQDLFSKTGHVCVGIVMFRIFALETVRFDLFPKYSSCLSVMKSLFDSGWKFGYFDYPNVRCLKTKPLFE